MDCLKGLRKSVSPEPENDEGIDHDDSGFVDPILKSEQSCGELLRMVLTQALAEERATSTSSLDRGRLTSHGRETGNYGGNPAATVCSACGGIKLNDRRLIPQCSDCGGIKHTASKPTIKAACGMGTPSYVPDWCAELCEQQVQMFREIFDHLDRDGDEKINVMELYEILETLNVGLTEAIKKEIRSNLQILDSDDDGLINYSAFLYSMAMAQRYMWAAKAEEYKEEQRTPRYKKPHRPPPGMSQFMEGTRINGLSDEQLRQKYNHFKKASKKKSSPYAVPLPFVVYIEKERAPKPKRKSKRTRKTSIPETQCNKTASVMDSWYEMLKFYIDCMAKDKEKLGPRSHPKATKPPNYKHVGHVPLPDVKESEADEIDKVKRKVKFLLDDYYEKLRLWTAQLSWNHWKNLQIDEIKSECGRENFRHTCSAYTPRTKDDVHVIAPWLHPASPGMYGVFGGDITKRRDAASAAKPVQKELVTKII